LIIDMSYSTYDGMVLRKSAIVTKYWAIKFNWKNASIYCKIISEGSINDL
jgi:hypothetical protein